MDLFEIAAVLLTLAAAFSYINLKLIRLPTTIGVMILSLAITLIVIGVGSFLPGVRSEADRLLAQIDFNEALMHGMLGFLLFAGALHVDLGDLVQQKRVIAALATIGIATSTLLIGAVTWLMLNHVVGIEVKLIYCFLFGALISPTDPIAVLSILKKLGVRRTLETKIAGESLFNDGVGIVVFLAVLGIAGMGHDAGHVSATSVAKLFIVETGGGAALGLIAGLIAYRMLKTIDNYQVEVLISLALVIGGYGLCQRWHLSGPIAMVVAGLFIGNHGRTFAMSESTRRHLDTFWELVDEILNAVLFVLIGLEVLALKFTGSYVLAGLAAIVVTLAARFIAVSIPVSLLRPVRTFSPHAIKVLTWGGLRGGISVALALSLKQGLADHPQTYQTILMMTYIVVVFSIVVQGLTIGPLIARWGLSGADDAIEH